MLSLVVSSLLVFKLFGVTYSDGLSCDFVGDDIFITDGELFECARQMARKTAFLSALKSPR